MNRETLLVGLAHPDDEVGVAGTILAQLARGDRVVIVWLTAGEMTEAFGALPAEEVAARRRQQGLRAAELLGAEGRFLDFEDTRVAPSPDSAARIARVICEYRPTGLLTWGRGWVRGIRHPDHQAAGQLFRDAVVLARIAKVVQPLEPHRAPVPVFTLRDVHSSLPAVAVDVGPFRQRIGEVAEHYLQAVGFGNQEWLENRLRKTGERWSRRYVEEFDAWETAGGEVRRSLLPARPLEGLTHPTREKPISEEDEQRPP